MLHRYPFGQVEDVSSSVVARSKSQDMHAGMQIPQKNKTTKSGDYSYKQSHCVIAFQ